MALHLAMKTQTLFVTLEAENDNGVEIQKEGIEILETAIERATLDCISPKI